MYQFINIDRTAELVKNIVENNCCAVCGKSNGGRVRYPCGHTSCESCVPATDSCAFCLTPQECSTFTAPSFDKPYSQRSQNAIQLLNVFQNEFNTDVYRRQRISNQLKVEKELFPKCIQAPAKYFNKRKSAKTSIENKENTHKENIFPGEEVTLSNKMENSNANVREWLSKCAKRKPLADLNYTRSTLDRAPLPKFPQNMLNTMNESLPRLKKKRIHTEICSDDSKIFVDAPFKKRSKKELSNLQNVNNDDSGIAVDDIIVIDDSQCIDKDLKACQAVLDAEKIGHLGSSDSKLSEPMQAYVKVPFYKKSYLFEKCASCIEFYRETYKSQEPKKNVSITIEDKNYTAIINVSKAENGKEVYSKHSVGIQTECHDLKSKNNEECKEDAIVRASSPVLSSKSEDIFIDEPNELDFSIISKPTNVTIPDSDTDEDLEASTSIQVTADVHRSCDEIYVLDDVADLMEHSKRPRRRPRGHTPTSTDSSDKENYNPNRMKKTSNSKKKTSKK